MDALLPKMELFLEAGPGPLPELIRRVKILQFSIVMADFGLDAAQLEQVLEYTILLLLDSHSRGVLKDLSIDY